MDVPALEMGTNQQGPNHPWTRILVVYSTCDEDEQGESSCTHGVVHQALDGQVAEGVEEGQEGGRVEQLAAEVEGAQEAHSVHHSRDQG